MGGLVKSIFGGPPKADPAIGQAALQNAEIGREMAAVGREQLAFAREQAGITNAWAEQDRARDIAVFRPLQDQLIEEARTYDSPMRRGLRRSAAGADVDMAAAQAAGANRRTLGRMGIDPRSGRAAGVNAEQDMRTTLAKAGAMTQQDRLIEAEAYQRKANAINMGSGLAINPLSAIQVSNSGTNSGAAVAMQGGGMAMDGQRDVIRAAQYGDDLKMKAYQTNVAALGDLAGAAGMYYGMK